jgi:hypothetical protein
MVRYSLAAPFQILDPKKKSCCAATQSQNCCCCLSTLPPRDVIMIEERRINAIINGPSIMVFAHLLVLSQPSCHTLVNVVSATISKGKFLVLEFLTSQEKQTTRMESPSVERRTVVVPKLKRQKGGSLDITEMVSKAR